MSDEREEKTTEIENAPERRERDLTDRREMFCQHYVTHWNATRAAKSAGYSENSAMEQGYQLLQIPSVKNRIKELGEHAMKEIGITRERILQEYANIAFLDPSDAYNGTLALKDIVGMPEHVRRAIKKIKTYEEYDGFGKDREHVGDTIEIEFVSKEGALNALAKYLGMSPDKVEHSGPGGKPIETKNVSEISDLDLDLKIAEMIAVSGVKKNDR